MAELKHYRLLDTAYITYVKEEALKLRVMNSYYRGGELKILFSGYSFLC